MQTRKGEHGTPILRDGGEIRDIVFNHFTNGNIRAAVVRVFHECVRLAIHTTRDSASSPKQALAVRIFFRWQRVVEIQGRLGVHTKERMV